MTSAVWQRVKGLSWVGWIGAIITGLLAAVDYLNNTYGTGIVLPPWLWKVIALVGYIVKSLKDGTPPLIGPKPAPGPILDPQPLERLP